MVIIHFSGSEAALLNRRPNSHLLQHPVPQAGQGVLARRVCRPRRTSQAFHARSVLKALDQVWPTFRRAALQGHLSVPHSSTGQVQLEW